jgi:GNAT superfamily N-acetyltransferase
MVTIALFEEKYAAAFKALNLVWLEQYNLTEEADLQMLNHPQEVIIDKGGIIFLALLNDEVVGTAALIKEHNGVYELAKMSVAPQHQGMGISRQLLQACLQQAKQWQATEVQLYSNSQLKAALGLYESMGFTYMPLENSPFVTADIKMQLLLQN